MPAPRPSATYCVISSIELASMVTGHTTRRFRSPP
jgi:hypothetical protein